MTRDTATLRARIAGVVLCVIEFHIEWLVETRGKTLQRRIACFRVCVADQAHWYRRCRELSAMAIGAGPVPWETRRR